MLWLFTNVYEFSRETKMPFSFLIIHCFLLISSWSGILAWQPSYETNAVFLTCVPALIQGGLDTGYVFQVFSPYLEALF